GGGLLGGSAEVATGGVATTGAAGCGRALARGCAGAATGARMARAAPSLTAGAERAVLNTVACVDVLPGSAAGQRRTAAAPATITPISRPSISEGRGLRAALVLFTV